MDIYLVNIVIIYLQNALCYSDLNKSLSSLIVSPEDLCFKYFKSYFGHVCIEESFPLRSMTCI